MLTLMYHRSTSITGRRLARLLGIRGKKHYFPGDIVVIRWGNSGFAGIDYAINDQQAIRTAAHGIRSLTALYTGDVPTLEFYTDIPLDEEVYPILGRQIYHRAGSDIIWCETPEEARQANRPYFTRYKPIDLELRVHVFGKKVLRIFKKVPTDTQTHPTIRTSKHGWGYRRVLLSNYLAGQAIAIKAVASLDLTFGGVDLGWNRETREYVVFEVNTGPSLNTVSLRYYAKAFAEYLLQLEEVNYELPSDLEGICRTG